MKKIKISELPLHTSLQGLYTIGTDSENRSVKVSLAFVEDETKKAVAAANEATTAATKAASETTAAATKAIADVSAIVNDKFVVMSVAQYEALEVKDENAFYYIYEDEE